MVLRLWDSDMVGTSIFEVNCDVVSDTFCSHKFYKAMWGYMIHKKPRYHTSKSAITFEPRHGKRSELLYTKIRYAHFPASIYKVFQVADILRVNLSAIIFNLELELWLLPGYRQKTSAMISVMLLPLSAMMVAANLAAPGPVTNPDGAWSFFQLFWGFVLKKNLLCNPVPN